MADIKETKEVEVVIKATADEKSIANAEKKMDKLEKSVKKRRKRYVYPVGPRTQKKRIYSVPEDPKKYLANSEDLDQRTLRNIQELQRMQNRFKLQRTLYTQFSPKQGPQMPRPWDLGWAGKKIELERVPIKSSEPIGVQDNRMRRFIDRARVPGYVRNKFNKKINQIMSNSLVQKARDLFDKQGPYENAPFRKAMMYIGSGMLLQYAVMMIGRVIAGVTQAVANTEIDSLTGREYRKELVKRGEDPKGFDETYKLYSERTGMATYESRAKFARLYGKINTAGVSTSNIDPNTIVRVMRGMQFMTGESEEQVDKRIYKLLTGRASKEEKKEFGVTSNNNPVVILKQIHNTLKKNASARVGMDKVLLQDTLRAIASAPKEMLDITHSHFPSIFNEISQNMKNFTRGFFGLKDGDTQEKWVAIFENINQLSSEVLTEESGQSLASGILETTGKTIASITNLIKTIKQLDQDTNGLVSKTAAFAVQAKLATVALTGLTGVLTALLTPIYTIMKYAWRFGMFAKGAGFLAFIKYMQGEKAGMTPEEEEKALMKYLNPKDIPGTNKEPNLEVLRQMFPSHELPGGTTVMKNVHQIGEYSGDNTQTGKPYSGTVIHAQNVYMQNGEATIDNMINGGM